MHQIICTNGPRKAGSALQRRRHLSNNLNRYAFPSKKSLRREERPYSPISFPTCTETWLGMLERSCLGREKHRIYNPGSSVWKEPGRGWTPSPAFGARLDRLMAALGRTQPGARLAPSSAQSKRVGPSVLRQVDIEGKMPK